MKHIGKRILSLLCVLCMLTSGAGYLLSVSANNRVLTRDLSASDGNTYRITVRYDTESGIPETAELAVSEIKEDDAAYDGYVAESAEALAISAEDVSFARAFDISLRDPETDEEHQPANDVSVSIELLDESISDGADVSVVHFGDEPEVVDAEVNGDAVEFAASGFSVYVVLGTTLEKKLTASDGNEYSVTVSYDSASGIPENAELVVSEIKTGDDGFDQYVSESTEILAIPAEKVSLAKAFDITLRDPETGEEYQPTKDVRVSIELLSEKLEKDANVGVVHFGEDTEIVEISRNGEAVEFETDGFSVYVIIVDEGGEIKTPRVEFHFLSQDYTEDSENPGVYSAELYSFVNKAGTQQHSQILMNGEALEMIQNPPNKTIDNGDGSYSYKYFYGWYIVDEQSTNSESVTYIWETDPEQIHFEKAITIDPDKIVWANDGHTAITSLVWEMDGVEHEVKASGNSGTRVVLDEFGCVHIYLAPIYEDYYFVNFHAGTPDSDLAESIIVRKLVVLGNDGKAVIRIGDVKAENADSQHKIFTGWEGTLWDDEDQESANRQHTTLDDVGEERYSGEGVDGYYIEVSTHDLYPGHQSVDLYPIFTEARWFKFVTGAAHNGATYVGDRYLYTTDQASEITNGTAKYYLTDLATTSRTGFAFKGWFADAAERDSNGDYIDGQQITDENGHIVSGEYTKYAADGVTPLYTVSNGRLYVFKDVEAQTGVTLYAHWEEITDTSIQVIIWRQKVSDDKSAFDYQKSYDFEAAYTIDTNTGMTLDDLRVNNTFLSGSTNYEAMTYTGFHYRTTEMNTARVRGDGSTVVNIYYDRDLMTIYYYYNSTTGDPAYTYTETTSNSTTTDQYGIVEGEYVKLTPVTGSGTKYTFRYDYQRTTSDTITPQYALVAHGSVKTYDALTREVSTLTNTRWHFQTGRGFNKADRYMDQGTTDTNIFYTRSGRNYVASQYTLDNPPPANSSTKYYCRYNYNYYELDAQTTTTTTYTWKLNGVLWSGDRYRRLAGTAEYTGDRYNITGDNTNSYGIDTRGGYVELDGTTIPAVTWYATTHTEDYELDNGNNGLEKDVYGLVDGKYVKLTPVLGNDIAYATANTYTQTNAANTAQSEQYALVNGEYVPLSWEVVETTTAWTRQYQYTPSNSNSSGYYYIYRNGVIEERYLYRSSGRWYDYYDNYQQYTGTRYTRSNASGAYTGTTYRVDGTDLVASTDYNTYTLYGKDGNNVYALTPSYTNRYGWANSGAEYIGNRYLKSAGASWSGDRYTRSGSSAPYAYTQLTGNPVLGQTLYALDGNQNGADNYGHVPLNWTASVAKYTYKDEEDVSHDYSGDRYSLNVVETSTEYTGIRYTRATQTGTYNRMLTYTGLYGQTLIQAGYTWPDQINGTNYIWYSSTSSQNRSRLTFLDAFLFADLGYATNNNTVLKLYGTATSQSGTYIYFYQQNLDGSYPDLGLANATNAIPTTSGGTFTFTNKYNGFALDTYSTNNGGSWSTASVNGSAQTSSTGLHIRFKRIAYDLTFEPNYPRIAGTTVNGIAVTTDNYDDLVAQNRASASVKYGASLSAYSSQPQPTEKPDNYTFGGWYVDETCTVEYTFSETMPAANMRLFAKWNPVKFRVRIDPNGGVIDHVDYTAAADGTYSWTEKGYTETVNLSLGDYGTNDGKTGHDSSQATFFNATYNELIGEYTNVVRTYVPISDVAAALMEPTEVYYYVNTQYIAGYDLESDLRNALYIIDAELDDYYEFYRTWVQYKADIGKSNPPLDFETWKETYLAKNTTGTFQKYRKVTGSEHYTFLGWYKLDANGEPETMPYNFSNPTREVTTLRAYWRLDAGYQIQYTPEYTIDNGVIINGSIPYWIDPQVSSARYADEATTHIYRQPTGITANGLPTEEYIFRGWRLVNVSTNSQNQPVYTPLEDDVFYDPGDSFTVHAAYADRNSVIHMQAVYEEIDSSYRRPYVTNLVLDANGGFLTLDGVNELQSNTNLSGTWTGVIGTVAATVDDNGIAVERIEFGDIQSNEDVHLYRYATELAYVDGDPAKAELDPAGKNYFAHPDGYRLLGFDDAANEGDYVATYPADSVIGVQRNEPVGTRTKYAVWEPLVYVKVVNATGVGPVTFGLSSSEGALQVVNARNGLYGRTPMTAAELSSITVADGDYVWLAVPYGVVKETVSGQETWVKRHITIAGTNDLGAGYLLSAKSELNGTARDTLEGSLSGTNADYTGVKNHKNFGFNEELEIDPEGIVITFTAVLNPHTLVLDDNYPTTGVRTEEVYFDKENASNAFGYHVVYGQDKALYYDLPTTSTRVGYVFLGWDPDPNWIADHPDYKTTGDKPTYTTGSAAGWRISSLTDFFKNNTDPNELDSVKTLYAVWDTSAEARIVYVYKEIPAPGDKTKEFEFTVALSGQYDYYYYYSRSNNGNNNNNPFSAGTATFSLKDGEYLRIESSQVAGSSGSWFPSLTTIIQKYNKDGVLQTTSTLNWTWDNQVQSAGTYRSFTFHNVSYTVTETDYSAAPHYYDTALTRTAQADDTYPLYLGESTDTTSLPLTGISGRVVRWTDANAGGRAVFTNTRQTADVTVKKVLESNLNVQTAFNFTASYTLSGAIVDLGSFSVTSGTEGHKLNDIPVGAALTVREVGTLLNDYETTVRKGETTLAVTETTSVSGSTTTYTRAVSSLVAKGDAEITFTNRLKSYPVTIYKVDQDGKAGVPSYFTLAPSTGVIQSQLYPAQTGTGEFFPGTSGLSNTLYVGTYTLTETFVSENYLPLDGPITLVLSANGGGTLTSSNTDYVKIEPVNAGDPSQGFRVYIYNQRIVKLHIEKILNDPILNSTRVFNFRVEYEYTLLDNTVTHDETVAVTSGTSKEIKIPANATLTVTEILGTLADVYDTTVQRRPETGTPDEKKTGTAYLFGSAAGCDHGVVTSANEGDTLTFTNTRKTVAATVKKLVDGYDPSDPERDDNYFTFTAKLLNGALPITECPIDLNGTPNDSTDDLKTAAAGEHAGEYVFYLQHNGLKTLSIPIGARLTVQETGVSSTSAHEEDVSLSNYSASVSAVYNADSTSYTAGSYTEDDMLYDMSPVPSKALTVTFTNGPGGKDVFIQKIDGFGAVLGGARFSLYDTYAHAAAGGSTGLVQVTVDDSKVDYVTSANDFTTENGVTYNVAFRAVPGVYYMKETVTPTGYQDNVSVYRVVVGASGAATAGVTLPDGKEYLIQRMSGESTAENIPDIAQYGILNESVSTRKVILKKIDARNLNPLPGARFTILRVDRSVYAVTGDYDVNAVFFIDDMPLGKYYLVETTAPEGYGSNAGKVFTLTVPATGAPSLQAGEH